MQSRYQKLIGIALLACGFTATAFENAVDFTGTWVRYRSTFEAGAGFEEADAKEMVLVIGQTGIALEIETRQSWSNRTNIVKQSFTLDGVENRNQTDDGKGVLKAKARLRGSKIVIEGAEQYASLGADFNFKRELSLSKAGDQLTMKTTRNSRREQWVIEHAFAKRRAKDISAGKIERH